MHQIFVNDKPIILTTVVEPETDFKNYLLGTVKISRVIKDLQKKSINSVRLIDADRASHRTHDKRLRAFLRYR